MATPFNWAKIKLLSGSRAASFRRNEIIAICLGLASLALGHEPAKAADAEIGAATQEASLLVATREITNNDAPAKSAAQKSADCDKLEPIPQASDHAPELAGTSEPTADRGKSIDAAKPTTHAVVRQPAAATEMQRDEDATPETAPLEPVKFQGIMVGQSTKEQLIANWGEPDKSVETPEGEVLAYHFHPFEAVEALVGEGNIVSAIKIALSTPLAPSHLAEQLSLARFRPAMVYGDGDEPLGQAFPERGVLFMFETADGEGFTGEDAERLTVSHVVVQPLDASSFAMRAENCLDGPYARNIGDLEIAISLDPDFAHARYLLAKIYLSTGQADLANTSAAKACELEPGNAAYQLCLSHAQELLGDYDAAVQTVRGVLDNADISSINKARALYQLARLASLGDAEIAAKAISFHTRAIEIADTVATSANGKERRAAKQLLVDAHMSIAEDVARQPFNEKVQTLSLWVGRASGLAEDFINHDGGSVELRLAIAQRALGALASFRPTLDPSPWVAEAEEAAEMLLQQSDDELWHTRVKWELGIAYVHALKVEHVRRETAAALRYGQLAVDNLAEGAASRQAVHSSELLVGQLYFQMGAVYAVHELDHEKAAQWYEKAETLLTSSRPVSELYTPRREGEMLVSMGVTYWQLGEQARALQLTQSGVNLVEVAVENGILSKNALAVPYGNLATMYKHVGETTNAAKYADLAKAVAAPVSEVTPRLGRKPDLQSSDVQQTNAQEPRRGSAMR
jgi:tetratricopeptide (TPR) repeat protein